MEKPVKVRKENERLVREGLLREEVLSTAAHNLKNPVHAVQMICEGLLDGTLGEMPSDLKEYICEIQKEVNTMSQLVLDFLEVVRVEAGGLELNRGAVDIRRLIEEGVESCKATAQGKGVALERCLPSSLPMIQADPERIRQVLDNLLSNAVKYTGKGGRVAVRAEARDGRVEVAVEDTGQGIPSGELSKVFDTFARVSSRPTAGESSTGLGLAVVRRLIELHGGSVWVQSEEGKGSTFGFRIPVGGV
jgi:signal transduction histidine kinase